MLVQPCDGVDVGEALEWTRWRCEGGVELPDQRRGGFILEKFVHRLADLINKSHNQQSKLLRFLSL